MTRIIPFVIIHEPNFHRLQENVENLERSYRASFQLHSTFILTYRKNVISMHYGLKSVSLTIFKW